MMDGARLRSAYRVARDVLLAERTTEGYWVGELSSSALSTATAVTALAIVDRDKYRSLIDCGLRWLEAHQNADGGWGDTVKSKSNISTTMLCRAAFHVTGQWPNNSASSRRCDTWLRPFGETSEQLAEAIRNRYGRDRTFSVPILMMCALGGLVSWTEVPRLPFEMACLPQSWYRFARMPVVSYALPALIAIGQVVHFHRSTWNPITRLLRWLGKRRSLRVLERIQPSSGGYLEATPLTSFVVMSLAAMRPAARGAAPDNVIARGADFIANSVRSDGSWPIDSNLSIWVTTLSINALAAADDLNSLEKRDALLAWLLDQQTKDVHPYSGAAPGAWGWSHLPGSVPDCDDTPGAVLALVHLENVATRGQRDRWGHARNWIMDLQNRDGGWPTFCRGWGNLPFDRSGTDLTAHCIRALWALGDNCLDYWSRLYGNVTQKGFLFLTAQQRPDGSWLPLWFGNEHAPDDINPVYGTARVLAAYRDLLPLPASGRGPGGGVNRSAAESLSVQAQRGVAFLLDAQNADGGWGGAKGTPSSVEETALAVEILIDLAPDARPVVDRGIDYLVRRVEDGSFIDPSPIGFYFAKLWYFEKLYPIIFTVAALGRAIRKLDQESA